MSRLCTTAGETKAQEGWFKAGSQCLPPSSESQCNTEALVYTTPSYVWPRSLLPPPACLGPGLWSVSLCSLNCHQRLNWHSISGQEIGGLKLPWMCALSHTEGQLSRLAWAPRGQSSSLRPNPLWGPWEKVGPPGQESQAGTVLDNLHCSLCLHCHRSLHVLGAVFINHLTSPVLGGPPDLCGQDF